MILISQDSQIMFCCEGHVMQASMHTLRVMEGEACEVWCSYMFAWSTTCAVRHDHPILLRCNGCYLLSPLGIGTRRIRSGKA